MIEILFGPIASGKSTYARQRAEEGAIIVNDDAIVMMAHGGLYTQYSELLKPMYKGIATHLITCAVLCDLDVVIDMPCRKRSTRDRYRLLALANDASSRLTIFRAGKFQGRPDGERRYMDDPRGLTLDQWREVGIRHARECEPVDSKEEELFTYVRDVPWRDPDDQRRESVDRSEGGGRSISLDASN